MQRMFGARLRCAQPLSAAPAAPVSAAKGVDRRSARRLGAAALIGWFCILGAPRAGAGEETAEEKAAAATDAPSKAPEKQP